MSTGLEGLGFDVGGLTILNRMKIELDDRVFPYPTSTQQFGSAAFLARTAINLEVQRSVVEALMRLRADDQAAIQGQYDGWQPARSYAAVSAVLVS